MHKFLEKMAWDLFGNTTSSLRELEVLKSWRRKVAEDNNLKSLISYSPSQSVRVSTGMFAVRGERKQRG
jgi:hypothetical protein